MPMGPCAGWDRNRFLPAETVLDRMAELEPIEAQGVARRYQLPLSLIHIYFQIVTTHAAHVLDAQILHIPGFHFFHHC